MAKKTEGVKILIQDVLVTFSEPYGEDIILEVREAIENNVDWHRRYQELSDELSDGVVNIMIGKYVRAETGLESLRVASAKGKSGLVKSYTKLGRG
jgi:hypothetical protein